MQIALGLCFFSSRLRRAALAAGLLTLPSTAQVTSTIQGQVSDPSGAAVPAATLRAKNTDTGVSRTTTSASDGYYRVSDLLPGRYEVQVEAQGFKTFTRTNIELNAQTALGLNITLEVGQISESISVSAAEVQVETQ